MRAVQENKEAYLVMKCYYCKRNMDRADGFHDFPKIPAGMCIPE